MPIKGLVNTLRFIVSHPLNRHRRFGAVARFFNWQLGTRLLPHAVVVPFAERSKMVMHRGLKGATQNLYCGLQEFEDMAFVLHYLRADDQFVDVGANVGSYTLLAASEVGAETVSVEPIPAAFARLRDNVTLNGVADRVQLLNVGMGARNETLHFTHHLDTTNHVTRDGLEGAVAVAVKPFDEVIDLERPTLVKIDVEGFETEVLNGMTDALHNPNLRGLIVELNGSGAHYGYDDADVNARLLAAGFSAYHYAPFPRELKPRTNIGEEGNIIYLKDVEGARRRVRAARKFHIHGRSL